MSRVARLGAGALWLALVAGSFGGCADPERRIDTAAGSEPLIQRIYDYGLSFGRTRTEIRRALGPPASADTTTAQNRHVRGATDSLFVLRYPGLTFELNRPGPVDEDLLTSVSLHAADRELPGGLRVGATSSSDLLRSLGRPASTRSRADTTAFSHQVPGPAAERFVEFLVADDTLRRVIWVPYVD